MLDYLTNWDAALFKFINGAHSGVFDFLMYWISSKYVWIPLYIYFIYLIFKKYKQKGFIFLLIIGLIILITDQLSTHLFKETIMRLRPSHDSAFNNSIHLVNNYKGGLYGFLSAHAANSIAVATFIYLLLRRTYNNLKYILLCWVLLIGYSRIYLGVHYPGDIICGWIFGMLVSVILFQLYLFITDRLLNILHE